MRKEREILIPVFLLAFACLCYASIVPDYFVSDDFSLIGRVARGGFFVSWAEEHGGFVRPGVVLSYVVDHCIWGLNPVGYHLTNILFHGLASCGVFLIARHFFTRAGSARQRFLSVLTACLFAALPCHSESVAWIAGRTDVIAVALGLGATHAFLTTLGRRAVGRCCLALLLLAAALLTKESVSVLPAIWSAVALHESWLTRRAPTRHSTMLLASSWLLLAGYFIFRKVTIGHFIGGYGTEVHLAVFRPSSVEHLLRFAARTFVPALPQAFAGIASLLPLLAAGTVLALLFLCFLCRDRLRDRRWSVGVLFGICYLAALVPVITMPVGITDTQGERFLYLPSAFACLALVGFLATCIPHARSCAVVLVLLVVAQTTALQFVNLRWITASRLAEEIAAEVAETDPADTVVLNLPDNYRGAYVFRNGLDEATTIFKGNGAGPTHRLAIVHDVNAAEDRFDARPWGAVLTLTLPVGARFEVRDVGLEVAMGEGFVVVAEHAPAAPAIRSFLSFTGASTKPLLRKIDWKAPAGGD
jgi:hypothetical protein